MDEERCGKVRDEKHGENRRCRYYMRLWWHDEITKVHQRDKDTKRGCCKAKRTRVRGILYLDEGNKQWESEETWQTRSRIKREDEKRRRTVEGAETVPTPRRNAYEDLKRTPNWKEQRWHQEMRGQQTGVWSGPAEGPNQQIHRGLAWAQKPSCDQRASVKVLNLWQIKGGRERVLLFLTGFHFIFQKHSHLIVPVLAEK